MNRVVLLGRLTADPVVKYTQGAEQMAVLRFTLAVDRKKKDEADFIGCVAFGKQAEFIGKYFSKGNRISLEGRIQTGSYMDREGRKVYTTDVIVDGCEFCENKERKPQFVPQEPVSKDEPLPEGFFNIPESADDAGLPFN